MDNFRQFVESNLSNLPHRARVTFAVASAERIQIIIDLLGEEYYEPSQKIIETTWQYVAGQDFSLEELSKIKDEYDENVPGDETMASYIGYGLASIVRAFDAISDKTPSSASLAAGFAREIINEFDEERGLGLEEEQKWQRKALETISVVANQQNPDYRAIIDSLNQDHPLWYKRHIE